MPWYEGDFHALSDHVDPEATFVLEIVRSAEPRLEACTGRAIESFAEAARAVPAAARVLYEELLLAKPAIEFDLTPRIRGRAQEFHAVRDLRAAGRANCLESALLFASCALQAQLAPVLLIVDAGELDHVLIGLWLTGLGSTRDRICEPDGTLAASAVPSLIGEGHFANSHAYWNGLEDADLLVVDCSGFALGYPQPNGQRGLNFMAAVEHGWKLINGNEAPIRGALDVRKALRKTPFPARSRPHIIGREDDLADLASSAETTNVLLHGTFGVGKSVLGLHYAFEYRHEYSGGVFWLNAADRGRALEQIADFARQCGLTPLRHDRSEDSLADRELASSWKDRMSEAGPRALLIVDDVTDAESITAPIADMFNLASLKCRLLITARDPNLLGDDHAGFESMVLPPLKLKDATALLLGELPPDRREEDVASRICRKLGNLPLALRVAGRTIAQDQTSTLSRYEQRLAENVLAAPASAMPSDYSTIFNNAACSGIGAVMDAAWLVLAERDGGPREVLRLLSFLPRNESIPVELLALLVNAGDATADEQTRINLVREAVAELNATGLAEQLEEDAVRIHPVVHVYASEKARDDPQLIDRALRVAADRLLEPVFYRHCNSGDLIRRGERLRLLRDPSRQNDKLSRMVRVFDIQLDCLRQDYDALPQLALQARLDGATELAAVLEKVRQETAGSWLRLRWYGKHERVYKQQATGHSEAVSAVAIHADTAPQRTSAIAVSGAENGELIQWSLTTLKFQKSRRLLSNIGAPISGLCIDATGTTVFASSRDGSLRAAPLYKGGQEGNKRGEWIVGRHAYSANDCALDPDGRFVVSISDDHTARVYDLPDGTLRHALTHPENAALLRCAVACDPQSRKPILITASRAGVVRAWDPIEGEEGQRKLDNLAEPTQPIAACALAPDGRLAAIATRQNVLLWDPRTGETANLPTPEQYVADCSFSPDGCRLMLVGRSKKVAIFNVKTRKVERRLDAWFHWLTACAYGEDGRVFYASDDGSVHTLKYSSQTGGRIEMTTVQGRPNWVNVFQAGEDKVLSVSTDRTICRWDLATGKREARYGGRANWINAFAVSTDGEHVLSGTDSGDVEYWKLGEDSARRTLTGFRQRANTCAISRNGASGLAGGEDCSLRQWSLDSDFRQLNHLEDVHLQAVTACAISTDGRYALSGGDDTRVVLWNLDKGNFERAFEEHEDRITATIFVPGRSDIVLSSSWDRKVKCWNLHTGARIKSYEGHSDSVTACGAALGGVVYSVSLDRTLRRWQLEGSDPDLCIHLGQRMRGLVVDPSGEVVVCSDMTGSVFLFDLVKGPDEVSRNA